MTILSCHLKNLSSMAHISKLLFLILSNEIVTYCKAYVSIIFMAAVIQKFTTLHKKKYYFTEVLLEAQLLYNQIDVIESLTNV